MRGGVRTTVWMDPDLWKKTKVEAAKRGLGGGASEILRESLVLWFATQAAEKSLDAALKLKPEIREWMDCFNEQRTTVWGQQMDPPQELRPLKLSPNVRKLIAGRLRQYGKTDLVSILYKVPWNDYLMGRGRWASNGPRLSPTHILKINSKINSIEVLREMESPEVMAIRGQMADLNEEFLKAGRGGVPDDIKRQIQCRIQLEYENLRQLLEELT